MVATDTLLEAGVTVFEAGSAVEALQVLEDHATIAVLFTDINMPGGMDGLELADQVFKLRPDVELIVTSGRLRLSDRALPDHGTFLPKPYRASDLIALIQAELQA